MNPYDAGPQKGNDGSGEIVFFLRPEKQMEVMSEVSPERWA